MNIPDQGSPYARVLAVTVEQDVRLSLVVFPPKRPARRAHPNWIADVAAEVAAYLPGYGSYIHRC